VRLTLRTAATAVRPAHLARGSASECNAHYRRQVERGKRHLLVCADRPTGLGHDSDAPAASGGVGQAGAAVDSIDDMRVLLRGLPLDGITATVLTGLPGAALLASLWCLVAQERTGGGRCRLEVALRPPECGGPPGPTADGYGAPLSALLGAVCTPAGVRVRAASPAELAAPCGPAPASSGAIAAAQAERLAKLRAWRCEDRVDRALAALRVSAADPGNRRTRDALGDALAAGASFGEVSGVLRTAWGGAHRASAAGGAGRGD
jgi:methylmalonyl-CoA mutase N-terminal domain/subunit